MSTNHPTAAQPIDLQPCPFCSGAGQITEGYTTLDTWPQGDFHRVFCTRCQVRQLFHESAEKAAEAWNTRALARQQPAASGAGEVAASRPTDISQRLREYAGDPGYSHNDYADTMRQAAEEIERYYGGMMAWKQTAEKKDRDWNAERMARVNERCEARAAAPAAPHAQAEPVKSIERSDSIAFEKGEKAFKSRKRRDAVPYNGSELRDEWFAGYDFASREVETWRTDLYSEGLRLITESGLAAPVPQEAEQSKWPPTPENVNALPEGVRRFVHDLATRCDPAGDVAALTGLSDQLDGMQIMYRKAADALADVRGCFHAAEVEGLSSALVDTSDERLKDLVERRLMHALYAAEQFDKPAQEAEQAAPAAVIDMLLEVARLAFDAMDSTEEDDDGMHWNSDDFDALSEAMDKLDDLPDDQPGYVMGPAAKAAWAMRTQPAAPAVTDAARDVLADAKGGADHA